MSTWLDSRAATLVPLVVLVDVAEGGQPSFAGGCVLAFWAKSCVSMD